MLRFDLLGSAEQQQARHHVGVKVFQAALNRCDAHPAPIDFNWQMPIFKACTNRPTGIQLCCTKGKTASSCPLTDSHEALPVCRWLDGPCTCFDANLFTPFQRSKDGRPTLFSDKVGKSNLHVPVVGVGLAVKRYIVDPHVEVRPVNSNKENHTSQRSITTRPGQNKADPDGDFHDAGNEYPNGRITQYRRDNRLKPCGVRKMLNTDVDVHQTKDNTQDPKHILQESITTIEPNE